MCRGSFFGIGNRLPEPIHSRHIVRVQTLLGVPLTDFGLRMRPGILTVESIRNARLRAMLYTYRDAVFRWIDHTRPIVLPRIALVDHKRIVSARTHSGGNGSHRMQT